MGVRLNLACWRTEQNEPLSKEATIIRIINADCITWENMIVFARGLLRRVVDSISIILSILADDTKPSCVVTFRTMSFVHFAQCTCSDGFSLERQI